MFKVVASGKGLKFFACVLDTIVSHQFFRNIMSAEMFRQCFDGILGSKVIEFNYQPVPGNDDLQRRRCLKQPSPTADSRQDLAAWDILFLLCRHIVVAHGTAFYFVFYLSAQPSLALRLNFTIPRCVPCIKASMAGLMDGGTTIFIPL